MIYNEKKMHNWKNIVKVLPGRAALFITCKTIMYNLRRAFNFCNTRFQVSNFH